MTTINKPTSTHATLFDVAERLFRDGSYHSTTIEQIVEGAQFERAAFDADFRDKEEFVAAYLDQRDVFLRNQFRNEVSRRSADDPREAILSIFDILSEWFQSESFYGCIFVNASFSYGQAESPVNQIAARHKRLFHDFILEKVRQLPVEDPDQKANEITFLMEGAIVTAHVRREAGSASSARKAAEQLLPRRENHATV